jgi:hypothetical protein
MITDVYVTYSNPKDLKDLLAFEGININTYNINSHISRKDALSLKSYWGAKLDPFAIAFNGDKAIKAFYSEADKNVINSLNNFLKDEMLQNIQ